MNGINLIPAPTRLARRRRRRIRAWSAATGVYTVLLLGSLGAFASSGQADEADAARAVTESTGHLEEERADLERWRQKAGEAEREADAARMMGNHPDWGVLLGLLAKRLGPEMTIESCELTAAEAAPAGQAAKPPAPGPGIAPAQAAGSVESYKITVTGLARTQSAVTTYTLDLEEVRTGEEKLFERVAIIEAKGRRIGSTDAVAFKVECVLSERSTPAERGGTPVDQAKAGQPSSQAERRIPG